MIANTASSQQPLFPYERSDEYALWHRETKKLFPKSNIEFLFVPSGIAGRRDSVCGYWATFAKAYLEKAQIDQSKLNLPQLALAVDFPKHWEHGEKFFLKNKVGLLLLPSEEMEKREIHTPKSDPSDKQFTSTPEECFLGINNARVKLLENFSQNVFYVGGFDTSLRHKYFFENVKTDELFQSLNILDTLTEKESLSFYLTMIFPKISNSVELQTCWENIWCYNTFTKILAAADKETRIVFLADEFTLLAWHIYIEELLAQKFESAHLPPLKLKKGKRLNFFTASIKTQLQLSSSVPHISHVADKTPLEREHESLRLLICVALEKYEKWTGQAVPPFRVSHFYKLLNKLTNSNFLKSSSFPVIFEICIAAKAAVDSNFAYEILQACLFELEKLQPSFGLQQEIPEREFLLEELFGNISRATFSHSESLFQAYKQGQHGKGSNFSQRRKLSAVKNSAVLKNEFSSRGEGQNSLEHSLSKTQLSLKIELLKKKYESKNWVFSENQRSCSFPLEDFFMEEFCLGEAEQRKNLARGKEIVSVPFQSEIGEGFDVRETIRNWHSKKIYVSIQNQVPLADIGAIIVCFEKELSKVKNEEKFSWRSFWHAEAHDKSHLMFYATPFEQELVGPGVAKSYFGGFSMLPLNANVFDGWQHDGILHVSKTPLDVLLLSAALSTQQRTILCFADIKISSRIKNLISSAGKSIIEAKLNTLAPEKLRRLATFHVLAESEVRLYAQDYIRKS